MLHLIVFLALLPAAIGTVVWLCIMLFAVLRAIFLAPFWFAAAVVRAVRSVFA